MIQIAKKKDNQTETQIKIGTTYNGIMLGILVLVLLAVTGFFFMIFSKVEIQTEGQCNSGNIGLDTEAYNNIQEKPCLIHMGYNESTGEAIYIPDPSKLNLTCFEEDLQLKHIKLKDIEGLNCQGSAKIKMPLILSFLGNWY